MTMSPIPPHPDWMQHGGCVDLPCSWWYPAPHENALRAKSICATCPVRETCLDHALKNGEALGIWGGKSARERKRLKKEPTIHHLTTQPWCNALGTELNVPGTAQTAPAPTPLTKGAM